MTYCNILGTTAVYIKKALLNSGYEIVTIGQECDIHTGRSNPWETAIPEEIKKNKYDFIFEVESGGFELEWTPDRSRIDIPVVWYGIDTHVATNHHVNRSSKYDVVFLAQRKYLQLFKNARWLPLACDPEIHFGNKDSPKHNDVTFVGNYNNGAHNKRTQLLSSLQFNVKLNVKKNLWNRDVTKEYENSYIIFNCSLAGDLNMRVFEALASGSMVLTDRIDESGCSEFFQDGVHLKYYRNEQEMIEHAKYYLAHSNQRNIIASAGQDEVLRNHTYTHRYQQYIEPALKEFNLYKGDKIVAI